MDIHIVSDTDQVEGVLNYLASSAERPVLYNDAYELPEGSPRWTVKNDPHTVPIRNVRPFARRLSLDREGFVLRQHPTRVRNFYDPDEVKRVYWPEIETLVKESTGAAAAVVFDTTVRVAEPGERGLRGPARRVHNDYTDRSGPQRVRDLLGEAATTLIRHRFAEINVWRPIKGPLLDSPLALCDAQTIAPEDFVATDLKYPNRTGETYSVLFNPRHRWYYFPKLERDEAVLIKCYDSERDGRARFTAHTAFDDPTTPPDAPPRESIEARALVFFASPTRAA
jgi:hypothetical protein